MTDEGRKNLSDRLRGLSPAQQAALKAKLTARRSRATEGPLSFTQQRQMFLDQLDPGNPTYNSPIAVRIEGRFDADAFEAAINRVIARHEMLRTRFVMRAGQPVQIVEPHLTIGMERAEVSEAELEERLRSAANQSFDLSVLPLVRANLFRLAPDDHALLVTMHHIIADGWSLGLFVREVVHHYYRRDDPLTALGGQYLDHVRWERSHADSREMADDLEWWRSQLDDAGSAPPFVPDKKPKASADHRGATHTFDLPRELVDALTSLAASKQTTLFTLLVSGVAAVLSRWSAQTEVMLGTPVANRRTQDAQSLIGLFVNTLVLRLRLSGNPSCLELIERTRNTVEQALTHQDVPFEKIVRSLNPRRGSETSPLFQVMLTYFNEPTRDYLDFPGVKWRPIEINRGFAYRDLTLRMGMLQTKFVVDVEYKTDLFNPETIENLALQLERVLGQIVEAPALALDELEVDFVSHKPAEVRPAWTGAGRRLFQRVLQQPKGVEVDRESVREEDRFGVPDWPLVYRATSSDVHLAAWFQKNRVRIRQMLHRHGAILWRGFGIRSAEQLLALARGLDAPPLDYSEKSTPRTKVLDGVYTSTEYPADQNIMLHNECAYFTRWPGLIFFCCLKPAERGGATTLGDMRKIYRRIDPAVRKEMIRRGVLYVRNFHAGTDLSWQEVYQTDDRERVNEIGRLTGAEMIWREDGGLSTRRKLPAVMHHPVTRDALWFNSAHMFHVASHRPAVRDALRSLYHDLLPRQAHYGDGGVIPDEVIEHIHEVYRAHIVPVHYRAGDVLLIDNLLTLHGRESFTGTREVLVILS